MRALLLEGVHRRKSVRTTRRVDTLAPAPDLVRRDFNPQGPDQLWVADITYVPTWSGFLYLAVVVDAFTRRAVGWRMADTFHTEVVLGALEMTLHNRKPKGVIHHSDRGSQYTSLAFGRPCREAGVIPSVGSVVDAYDNAMAESSSPRSRRNSSPAIPGRTAPRLASPSLTTSRGFHNPQRRYSSLSMLSPAEFERRLLNSSAA